MNKYWKVIFIPFVAIIYYLFTINFSQAGSDESVQLYLEGVNQFQTDEWSCGIHSAYRILKGGYEQPVDYNQMKEVIGKTNVHYHSEVIPGLVTIDFDLNEDIGRPTSELISFLEYYRQSTTVISSASNARIMDLLWAGRPVMVLIQVGSKNGAIYDGCIGFWLWGKCVGQYYHIDTNSPLLHWIVAVGYDSNYIYYKDTNSNKTFLYSWFDFQKRRAWELLPYNQDIAKFIQDNGAHPGDIIYFDESITESKIYRTGYRTGDCCSHNDEEPADNILPVNRLIPIIQFLLLDEE